MFLTFVLHLFGFIFPLTKSYEVSRSNSNEFLKTNIIYRSKYEQLKEITETKRELCLDEYRQQLKFYQRRHYLSPLCAQYCSETNDCQQNNEPSACMNPSWPERTLKYVQKIERMCYIRFTEILHYEQAEQMCRRYGLELAVIDNIPLLERLHQLQMFNTTCRGLCPRAKGYYIGLKRFFDESNQTKWIWSNNITWTQNEISCDNLSYPNANSLCYLDRDGTKKITVWNKGEPNNYQQREACVEILATTDRKSSLDQIGKLNDIPCTKPTLGVICQGKDMKPTNSTRFEYFATIIGFNETDPLLKFEGLRAFDFDSMNAMIDSLEALLSRSSFTTDQARNILNLVDQLVNVSGQIDIEQSSLKYMTNKLLHFLDLFPQKIQFDNNIENLLFQFENLNMLIIDMNFNENQSSWLKINENTDVIIEINSEYFQKTHHRIIETIFSNFNLFPEKNYEQIGIPIGYQIGNLTHIQTENDLIRYQIRVDRMRNISCVYWSFDIDNGSWISDETCRFNGYRDNYAQCYCNHLTHFALLLLTESDETVEELSTIEEYILTLVTYLGICLSIFGLILTMITYGLFRYTQRNHLHGALIMLCISIFIVNCLYIPFTLIKSTILCLLIGYLFHYFLLCSFMWMLIIAIVQYIHFVRIFNTHISHFFLKTSLIGWIVPFIFPTFVVIYGSYIDKSRCWINDSILLYLTFLIPILLIVCCNCILFGLIVQSIFSSKTIVVRYQKNHAKLQIGATLCCFVSIGCTWLFGLIVVIQPNFLHQLIFCLANSFQGFFIFLFHVYLSKPKRELWQFFFTKRQTKKSSQSSSTQIELATISKLPRLTTFRFTSRTSSTTIDQIKNNSYA